MLRFVRFKGLLFATLIQPALWMALFGIAMSGFIFQFGTPEMIPDGVISVEYLTFMSAGVIAMTALFTSLFGGITILFDRNYGLMREILVSPMPRSHLLIGIGLAGLTKACIQAVIIMIFGFILGVRFWLGETPADIILSIIGIFAFISIFSIGFLFLSVIIAMKMESHEGVQAVITLLSLPLFFTSNALYPVSSFPVIMQYVAGLNPLTHLINGIRFFAIGEEFYALGTVYRFSSVDIAVSFTALLIFAGIMFLIGLQSMKNAHVN